ncbi:MAG: hypothetical protein R3B93_23015 [Bacteroidia bacterium]
MIEENYPEKEGYFVMQKGRIFQDLHRYREALETYLIAADMGKMQEMILQDQYSPNKDFMVILKNTPRIIGKSNFIVRKSHLHHYLKR